MDGLLPITEYENARIIGLRATQLANGAKPMTDIKGLIHVLDIAEKEYREGVIPINVIRTLPSGQKIEISIVPMKPDRHLKLSDEDDDKRPAKRPVKKAASESSEEESSDDEDDKRPAKKAPSESSEEESSDDEDDDKRPAKKAPSKSSEEESSDDEDDKRPAKKAPSKSSEEESSDDEDDNERKIEVELCDKMTKSLLQKNPRKLYLFGDNEICQGIGGQAQVRGEPNAMGIPTKKLPSFTPDAFWTDDSFKTTTKLVCRAISKVRATLLDPKQKYTTLVLPRDGFGTGLAKLNSDKKGNTWKTLKGLKRQIYKLAADFGHPEIGKDMSGEWKEN